jgi:hypothetical protein
MITRFRVEAEGETRDAVLESLRSASNQLLVLSVKNGGKLDQWEVTQELVETQPPGIFTQRYKGRLVMKLKDKA